MQDASHYGSFCEFGWVFWCLNDCVYLVPLVACRTCDDQKKLLLSVAGSNVELSDVTVRMARLSDDWQNLDIAIKAFDEMIEEQRSAIKASVEGEVS